VLIDVPLFSDSVAQALGRTEGFEAHGFDPHGGGEPLARYRPHIVLVDAGRDETAALVSDLAQTVPDARVVAVAMPESDQQLFACAEAGLAGLVPWDATLEEVVATLRAVAQGELPCSPRIAAALLRRIAALAAGNRAGEATAAALTRRELEIARLIDEGLSNKEIALNLCIEVPTVKNHACS
jgi:two-component system, NarL family, nitrate/nitrite response regulator NarL